jgi:hypothetical protein
MVFIKYHLYKAKEMGHEAIVISLKESFPYIAIDGNITTVTELVVLTIGYVVDSLNLHGAGFES